jgi:hypothetical protein
MVACGDDPPPLTLPNPPGGPPTVSEVFAGEINRNGAVTHTFLAGSAGNIVATLDSLGPEGVVTNVGLLLGTWNGSSCQTVIANDSAAQGSFVIGAASIASNLCVRIYDVGKIPALASYQVTVVHP